MRSLAMRGEPGSRTGLLGSLRFARSVATAALRTRLGRVQEADYAEIRESGLFDPGWYLGRNPDAAWAFVDPLRHYLATGSAEGRQPCPLFDPAWYRARYPRTRGTEPFTHFLRSGGAEGLSPGPFFDARWYRHRNGAFDDEGLNPLVHYLGQGAARGLDPSPRFDTDWYASEYAGELPGGVNPLVDYVERGRWRWHSTHETQAPPGSPVAAWRDVPWSAAHPGHGAPVAGRGHHKLLLVLAPDLDAEQRGRTAGLVAALSGVAELETFVVARGGGDAFAPLAATLDLAAPELATLDPRAVATRLAQALRDLAPFPTALLIGDEPTFRAAFERFGVPCLDWPPGHGEIDDGEALLDLLTYRAGLTAARPLAVSAILPALGPRAAVAERLESILAQTRPPVEIIVLEDGSRTESLDFVEAVAGRSAVPLTVVRDDGTGPDRFGQWRRGIERAGGDLVWLAEPDGAALPDFLEQLVPLFFDDQVMLAWTQSEVVGAAGEVEAVDSRALTDDLSATRWSRSYRADGMEEIALALSQKNTLPSVGAALFRRRTLASLAPFLSDFRAAGDWWLALEAARRGDVAFVARAASRHRRPERPAGAGREREAGPLAEILRLKAGLFRDADLPVNVMHRSLGQSVHEHVLGAHRPEGSALRFFQHPGATASLQSMRGRLDARLADAGRLRLILLDGPDFGLAREAATQLAGRATALLLADEPTGEGAPAQDEPALLFEGTRGAAPWAAAAASGGGPLGPEHRVEVLSELARFHRVDALVSLGAAGRALAPKLSARAGLPWLVVLTGDMPIGETVQRELEAGADGLVSTPARLGQALAGRGASQFLGAVGQAIARRRDRFRGRPAGARPDQRAG